MQYGQLFYRLSELSKIRALKIKYDFERIISLSEEALQEIRWWLHEGLSSSRTLVRKKPSIVIKSDSSGYAWGAVMNIKVTHGMWQDNERQEHINRLE